MADQPAAGAEHCPVQLGVVVVPSPGRGVLDIANDELKGEESRTPGCLLARPDAHGHPTLVVSWLGLAPQRAMLGQLGRARLRREPLVVGKLEAALGAQLLEGK
jgi:hypothetical protein